MGGADSSADIQHLSEAHLQRMSVVPNSFYLTVLTKTFPCLSVQQCVSHNHSVIRLCASLYVLKSTISILDVEFSHLGYFKSVDIASICRRTVLSMPFVQFSGVTSVSNRLCALILLHKHEPAPFSSTEQ